MNQNYIEKLEKKSFLGPRSGGGHADTCAKVAERRLQVGATIRRLAARRCNEDTSFQERLQKSEKKNDAGQKDYCFILILFHESTCLELG